MLELRKPQLDGARLTGLGGESGIEPTDLIGKSLDLQLLSLRLTRQPYHLGRRGVEPIIARKTAQVGALACRLHVAHQLA